MVTLHKGQTQGVETLVSIQTEPSVQEGKAEVTQTDTLSDTSQEGKSRMLCKTHGS